MSPRYDDQWIKDILDAERRLGTTTPRAFLASNGLGRGQSVVDLGCGPGFLTLPAADIVGLGGQVYAVDIKKEMLDLV